MIHDPLYKWNLSPLEARKRQQRDDNENDNNNKNDNDNNNNDKNNNNNNVISKSDSLLLEIASRENNRVKNTKIKTEKIKNNDKNNNNTEKTEKNGKDNQSQNHGFGRDAAEKTLLRIKNKLQGYEDLTSGTLGVEGQVELVITEARNIDNLCKLFCGWSQWL